LRRVLLDTPPEGYAGCCEAIAAMDLRDELGAIVAPTLVLAGADDPATPPEHAHLMVDSIRGSRLLVVDEAAHMLCVERPEAVGAALLEHFAASASPA
jgi:3-oxoadipate enol-lactonase